MNKVKDFPFEELTYKVIGCLYSVYNELGFGHPEKIYQRAIAKEFDSAGINYKKENISKIHYKDVTIGYYFHDFLIENKIILEVKVGSSYYQNQFRQIVSYLKDAKLRLGVVSIFGPNGVIIKRVINPDQRSKSDE